MKTDELRKLWHKAHVRGRAGKPERYEAVGAARRWIGGLQECCLTWLSQSTINAIHDRLHRGMVKQVAQAMQSHDASFFRHFADALEAEGRNFCDVRAWLANKHRPDEAGTLPRFTHQELLDDADARGLNVSDRQLRRLMAEAGFRFKHSRRK